ncbi:MAG: TonB-dependent receptor [Pseudomonadota bacterium]
MHKKIITHAVQAAVFTTSIAIPHFVTAQEAALEEVVVIARRRTEDLQDVPISVTVFSETDIEDAGINRPQDFISLTPNVSMVDTANAGDTQVTIRGQYSTRDAESSFAYVVDGVLITNPNAFNQELYDIEQIEVLKGPQGALYGRNAVSGAIIVSTKRPTDEFESSLKGTVGEDNLWKGQAMVSGPIIEDQLYGRLTGFYGETDGQFENDFTGADDVINNWEETAVRGRLIWEPSDQLSIDGIASYRKVKGGAINFNAVFALDQAAELVNQPAFFADVNDHNFKYIFNVPGENEQTDYFVSLKADYETAAGTLTLTGAYDDMEEDLISDGTSGAFGVYSNGAEASRTECTETYNTIDYGPLLQAPNYAIQDGQPPGTYIGNFQLNSFLPPYGPDTCDGYQYQERNQKNSSFEARFTSNDDSSLRWLGGAYYARIDREVVVAYGADLGLGFDRQPYVPPEGPNPTDQLFWDDFITDVYAAFGQIELDVGSNGELALALRYDVEDRKVENKVPDVLSAQAYGGGNPINPAFNNASVIPDRSESFDEWQPKISYTYAFTDDISAYASWGRGFRSGGFNSIGSEATVNGTFGTYPTAPQNIKDDYDKEVTDTSEIGLKSLWLDGSLRFNAAVFYTEVEDYQFFNFFAGPFGLLRVVNNVDDVEIWGAEFDFAWRLTESLTFTGGYGGIDTEIKSNSNRPYTEGNKVPYAPDGSGSLSLEFKQGIFEDLEFSTRVDYEYVGKTWFHTVQDDTTVNFFTNLEPVYGVPGFGFGTSNYSRTERDAYWKMNLRIGIAGENWSIVAWSNNVTDEDYLEEVIPAPEFGGSFAHDTAGRISGVDLTYNF